LGAGAGAGAGAVAGAGAGIAATGSVCFEELPTVGMTPKMAATPAAERMITATAAIQRRGCSLLLVAWASMLVSYAKLQRD